MPSRFPAITALFLCLFPACSGGGAPLDGTRESSTSTSPTTPGATTGDDARVDDAARPDTAGVCAEYLACVAKKAPEMLDVVTDAYGKSGSCWTEMSAQACEDACAAGKAKTKCDVCDPAVGSCLGEPCAVGKRCATGEVCAKGTCIEDAYALCGPSADGADCPAPWQCKGAGDGYACLLSCAADDECPSGWTCYEPDGVCWR